VRAILVKGGRHALPMVAISGPRNGRSGNGDAMKWADLPARKPIKCDYCDRLAIVTDPSGLRFCAIHLPEED